MMADEKMECGKCSRRKWYQKGYKDAKQMDERIVKIANEYGYASQSRMLIEEMAELTQAICKYNRALLSQDDTASDKAIENVMGEMADVQIMLLQMQFLLRLSDKDLKKWIDKKLDRQMGRIEVGEEWHE